MWLTLTLLAAAGFACSGATGLLGHRRANWGHRFSVVVAVAAAMAGLTAAIVILLGTKNNPITLSAPLPIMTLRFHLDPLGAFFQVPIFLIGALGSIYGLDYWRQSRHPRSGRGLRIWFGLLIAGMAVLTVAGSAMSFLVAWEVMAMSAFFLIATEDHKPAARQAAWVYLVATHGGTLLLLGLFALLHHVTGTWNIVPLHAHGPHAAGLGTQTIIFLLALTAFGMKAGMMPLHFWLPEAHASAPSHVSATLSGVMIKMGIFGLLRVLFLLPAHPLGWGLLVMALGLASTFLGVLWAIGQHDLKKLLAYHSVENIGIILMGLGLALIGEARHEPIWIMLGLAGCLLHVWNHGLFKSLLFLSAGSAIHAGGTRDMDKLGGLSRAMPVTAALFLTGACAICGFPPLNGFISELFIYLGLFSTLRTMPLLATGAVILAMAGALAAACFTKAFGTVFLGVRRHLGRKLHEAGSGMWVPMLILALACLLIGLFPIALSGILERTARALHPYVMQNQQATVAVARSYVKSAATTASTGHFLRPLTELPQLGTLVPFGALSAMGLVLLAMLPLALLLKQRADKVRKGLTWDCGYAQPSPRMQYTAASLGRFLLRSMGPLSSVRPVAENAMKKFAWLPAKRVFHTHADDPVLKTVLTPVWQTIRRLMGTGKRLQQGSVQSYLLYMLVALVGLLALTLPVEFLFKALF